MPKGHIHCTSEIWIFEMIFVVFGLMKNIIFNKTKSFVGRNTSDHACQIICSKSNCETMYHWLFPSRDNQITVVKIMNNLNICSAHSYLYSQSWFKNTIWNLYIRSGTIKFSFRTPPLFPSGLVCTNLNYF